jgi:hypothetical protein
MYRPQFAYATPVGCIDKDFVYLFDSTNTPMLATSISGRRIEYIPLPMEQDAPFYLRGVKVGAIRHTTGGAPVSYDFPDFAVKLRDCFANDLSDGFIQATEYGFAQNPLNFNGSLLTGPPVPLEPEIYCPPGGIMWAFLLAPVLGADTYLASFALHGIKRFKECRP